MSSLHTTCYASRLCIVTNDFIKQFDLEDLRIEPTMLSYENDSSTPRSNDDMLNGNESWGPDYSPPEVSEINVTEEDIDKLQINNQQSQEQSQYQSLSTLHSITDLNPTWVAAEGNLTARLYIWLASLSPDNLPYHVLGVLWQGTLVEPSKPPYKQAIESPRTHQWEKAIDDEVASPKGNNTSFGKVKGQLESCRWPFFFRRGSPLAQGDVPMEHLSETSSCIIAYKVTAQLATTLRSTCFFFQATKTFAQLEIVSTAELQHLPFLGLIKPGNLGVFELPYDKVLYKLILLPKALETPNTQDVRGYFQKPIPLLGPVLKPNTYYLHVKSQRRVQQLCKDGWDPCRYRIRPPTTFEPERMFTTASTVSCMSSQAKDDLQGMSVNLGEYTSVDVDGSPLWIWELCSSYQMPIFCAKSIRRHRKINYNITIRLLIVFELSPL